MIPYGFPGQRPLFRVVFAGGEYASPESSCRDHAVITASPPLIMVDCEENADSFKRWRNGAAEHSGNPMMKVAVSRRFPFSDSSITAANEYVV